MNVYAHRFAQITNATYIKRIVMPKTLAKPYTQSEWLNERASEGYEYWYFNISHNAIFDNWFDDLLYHVSYSLFRLCQALCCYNESASDVFTSSSQ